MIFNPTLHEWEQQDIEYCQIHRFFRTSTEPYDDMDWDGETLKIILEGRVVEKYDRNCLKEMMPYFGR